MDGRWVPTFPNATYIFAGEEWEYWRHEKDEYITDSVMPVVDAGRSRLVQADHVIDPWLRMEPSTPDYAEVRLTTWPTGEQELLAQVGYHGADIRWVASA